MDDSYFWNQSDQCCPLYYNYANDTTLISDSSWRLLLLSQEPSGFPCVNHKERDILPAKQQKREALKLSMNYHRQQVSLYFQSNVFIYSFPALTHISTPHYYIAAKQLSLNFQRPWWGASNKEHDHGGHQLSSINIIATVTSFALRSGNHISNYKQNSNQQLEWQLWHTDR